MNCKKCGNQLRIADRYCPKCGHITRTLSPAPKDLSKNYKNSYLLINTLCTLWLIGFLFVHFIFMLEYLNAYGIERVIRKSFAEYWGASLAIIIYCIASIIKHKLRFSAWKFIRTIIGMVTTTVIWLVIIFSASIDTIGMNSAEVYEWVHSKAIFIVILMVIAIVYILIYAILLYKQGINLLKEQSFEMSTAILGATISALLLSILLYSIFLSAL